MNKCNNDPLSMWPQSKLLPGSKSQKDFLNRSSTPPLQQTYHAVDVLVVGQRQVFQLQTVVKTVEALPTQFVGIVASQLGNLRPT